MDEIDSESDAEPNGDERDLSWSEWHTRWDKLSPAGNEAQPDEVAFATEDDEDDDPAGGSVDDTGEADDWRPEGIVLDRPRYGVDQSQGPENEAEMMRNFNRAQLGLPAQEKNHA